MLAVTLGVSLTAASSAAFLPQSPFGVAKDALAVRELANPHGPAQFAIAPDGDTIAYVVAAPRGDDVAYTSDLWIGSLADRGKDRLLFRFPDSPSAFVQPTPRFSPDGRRVAFLLGGEVEQIDLQSGTHQSLTKSRLPEGSEAVDFAWSPDGHKVAIRLAMPAPAPPEGGRETSISWPLGGEGPGTRLAVLEASGPARFVSGPELDVAGMSWSPNGRSIALAASPVEASDRFYAQDIYLADVGTGRITRIATLDGVDSEPVWSPDGRHLAFATQAGAGNHDWLQQLGIVNTANGAVSFPASARFDAELGSPHDIVWRDSNRVLFTSAHHLRSPIFQVDLSSGKLDRLTPLGSAYFSGLAIDGAGRTLLFGCEAVNQPRELCASSPAKLFPRRITNLNPALVLPAERISVVSWKSADARWNLDGVLIEPKGRAGPVPTITLIEGGPSMVRMQYQLEQQYPVHAFVASGYAVFLPNTRGRSGYSKAFRRAIAQERDYVGGGYGDLMSGLDRLVSLGIADPKRLGLAGFSYGGVLSAYAMTQTDRFAAVSILDAPVDFPQLMKLGAANPVMQAQWRDQVGYGDPYDPTDRALMDSQSPLSRVDAVRTPALLEYGAKAYGGFDEAGAELFQGLQRFNVPSMFVRYPRTGHGIYEPRLRIESAKRNLDWFARWLPRPQGD